MAVTLRKDAKLELIRLLREQGYATYARLVDYFDIYLTDDPEVVGYMVPTKAKIVLNMNLTMDQVSTVVRHEILHEFLTHMERNDAFHKAHGATDGKLGKYIPVHELSNIAGDFEISNLGYTDADKREMKRLKLNGQTLQGLVTELDRPGWENLTYEEMYQRLLDENDATKDALENLLNRISQLNKQDLEDLENEAQDIEDQNGGSQGSGGSSSDEDSSKEGEESGGNGAEDKESEESNKDANSGDQSDNGDKESNKADKARQAIADAANKLKGQLKDIQGKQQQMSDYQQSEGSGGFMSQEDQRDAVDIAARVKAIEDLLRDLKTKSDMLDEVRVNRQKEKAIRQAKDVERFRGSGLSKFKMALNRFIQNEIIMKREETYRKLDPRYEDSEFIMPGEMETPSGHIPVINVYWDASGSFSPPQKTAAAKKAIETLNKYVRSGEIKMNVWYHGVRISDTFAGAGGGNRSNIVEEHILETRPDNVIVITDGDLSNDTLKATVPGAVWMLFYDTRSSGLMNSLHGKKETKYFDIEY